MDTAAAALGYAALFGAACLLIAWWATRGDD